MTRSRFSKAHRQLVGHLLRSGAELPRRDFLKSSMALALGGALPVGLASRAFANHHPHPHEGSIDFLDRNMYIHDMEVLQQFEAGKNRRGDLQFMCRGEERYLFQLTSTGCAVYDITNPLQPSIINEGAFEAQQIQVAYSRMAGRGDSERSVFEGSSHESNNSPSASDGNTHVISTIWTDGFGPDDQDVGGEKSCAI